MSNPGAAAAQAEDSFVDKVKAAVDGITVNIDGIHILPGDLDDNVKVAAEAEKRRRDTQSSFSKSQHKLKEAEAEVERLKSLITPKLNLTSEQKEELYDLKNTDPDKWLEKLTSYETEAKQKLDEDLKKVKVESSAEAEISRRAQVLEEFLTENPEFTIDDDILTNDIPQRIKNKLESGSITFEKFLAEAKEYLSKGKKVATGSEEKEPNLGKAGGGSKAAGSAVEEDIIGSYTTEVY